MIGVWKKRCAIQIAEQRERLELARTAFPLRNTTRPHTTEDLLRQLPNVQVSADQLRIEELLRPFQKSLYVKGRSISMTDLARYIPRTHPQHIYVSKNTYAALEKALGVKHVRRKK